MLLDDVYDALIELVFQGEIDAFFDVRYDDQDAHRRREIIVRVAFEAHVLGEIFRLHQLADVMKVRANAAERCVCTDGFGRCFGKIGYHQTMMVGARRLDCHTA